MIDESTAGAVAVAATESDEFATGEAGPIEGYALLSDLRTAALVDRTGSIDWLCLPRFDSPSCFSRLLGDGRDGYWQIAPTEPIREVRRRYRDHSLVLETEFHTDNGVVRLIDSMPPNERLARYDPYTGNPLRTSDPRTRTVIDEPCVVRIVEGVSGTVPMKLRWVLRFAYGDSVPWISALPDPEREEERLIRAVAGPHAVVLRGNPLPRAVSGEHAHQAVFSVAAGQRCSWVMQWSPAPDCVPARLDPEQETRDSEYFWHAWTSKINYSGQHAPAVYRSLCTLKALTYSPTGGIVAAPTTSLPEALGGERNWDYRYCWLRDATLTLLALDNFGCQAEARDWRQWLLRAVAGDPADLQIMYGVDGSRHLLEWQIDWLAGYQGASPVRVGNGAYRQLQLDVFGEVMDALHLARERGLEESNESWALQRGLMRHLETIWQEPDHGLWEVRGPARHFTHSRVMVWVAFDRAVRAIEEDHLPGPLQRWREIRDSVREEILQQGFNNEIGVFTQYYGGTEVDAATLLIPAVGFLPGTDERVRSTIRVVEQRLRRGSLVDRYSTNADGGNVDGLTGREGSFLVCSFWLVDALTLCGRRDEAEELFNELVGLSNDVGLYAEEFDVTAGRFTGNFPQAFSHLGLVNSASVLYGGHTRGEPSRRNGV